MMISSPMAGTRTVPGKSIGDPELSSLRLPMSVRPAPAGVALALLVAAHVDQQRLGGCRAFAYFRTVAKERCPVLNPTTSSTLQEKQSMKR